MASFNKRLYKITRKKEKKKKEIEEHVKQLKASDTIKYYNG